MVVACEFPLCICGVLVFLVETASPEISKSPLVRVDFFNVGNFDVVLKRDAPW